MLIQKVFHVRQSIDNARERLSGYRYFSDRFGGFFRGSCHLELLPTDDSHQMLFHSTGGEMELHGMMELLPVRDRLTEVQLTIDNEIQTPLRRTLNRVLRIVNRCIHREILELKRQMEDEETLRAPVGLEPSRYIPAPPAGIAGELHPAV